MLTDPTKRILLDPVPERVARAFRKRPSAVYSAPDGRRGRYWEVSPGRVIAEVRDPVTWAVKGYGYASPNDLDRDLALPFRGPGRPSKAPKLVPQRLRAATALQARYTVSHAGQPWVDHGDVVRRYWPCGPTTLIETMTGLGQLPTSQVREVLDPDDRALPGVILCLEE